MTDMTIINQTISAPVSLGPAGAKGDKGDKGDTGDITAAAAASAALCASNAASTAADKVHTGEDRAQTGKDVISTAADRVQTGLDKSACDSLLTDCVASTAEAWTSKETAVEAAESAAASMATCDADKALVLAYKNTASGRADAALVSENAALASAGVAAEQAAIATTQAGVATTQSGIAATQADEAEEQAGIATTQAGIATTAAADTDLDRVQTGEDRSACAEYREATLADVVITHGDVESADMAAELATTKAGEASASAAVAGASAQAAQEALDNAVAVVYEGDASIVPSPGKLPVAGADGRIDATWIRQHTNDIGQQGAQGFGVGICPEELPVGMVEMTGTRDKASDNYGNYQYSDGSIMCWVPAFFYKYGDGANGLAVNDVEIRPFHYYANVSAANDEGFALHRAFYDGGVIKSGFFVDKYECSNNAGIASSIKNGAPLTSAAVHNPFSGLNGAPANILGGAIAAAKTRGTDFFCLSMFGRGALALLSLAHGLRATSATWCAWYDAGGVTSFPKGNNNNALSDYNDSSISYVTDGYPNCGLTGSGVPFAKTTHNGQESGCADLNGNLWEISPGLTTIGVSRTIVGISPANPCVVNVPGHGLATGDVVRISGIVGPVAMNDKIYQITVVDGDYTSLDGVDSSGLPAYVSGGVVYKSSFYALKTSTAMKDVTGGSTIATDMWGAVGIAAICEPVALNFNTTYPGNSYVQRFGNADAQVLPSSVNGNDWALAGMGLPAIGGVSGGGSNSFGADYYYTSMPNELCPRAGGGWYDSYGAGVWTLHLGTVRGYSPYTSGFRAALYL